MPRLLLFVLLHCLPQLLWGQIRVIDDAGLPVILEQPANRIITLSPHSTELVVAAGAASQLVGVAWFDDYPPAIRELPVVSHYNGLDREQLLMLQPDLVVAWASGNKPNDISWLRSAGIPVYLSEPARLEDIPVSMEKLGVLSGHRSTAAKSAHQFRIKLSKSCPQRERMPLLNAYYEIWPRPPMTIGGKHWLNHVLAIARLRNVFADQKRQIISVSPETLLYRSFQIKITSFETPDNKSHSVKLIRGNNLLARPGPGIIQGLRLLCEQL